MKSNDTDVIIVGGGPAGMAAAVVAAKNGLKTVLLERGDFCGSKNMFGGAIYTQPTLEIYPDFQEEAPLERGIIRHSYAMLGENDGTIVSYDNNVSDNKFEAYSVLRPKWDRWCATKAENAGAFIIPRKTVRDLIIKDGKISGIKTDNEEFYSKIVILADGVNSLLAKKYGFRKEIKPHQVAISVKQTLSLPKEILQERFNLSDNNGSVYTIMGGSMLGVTGLGFIYTNKESISIGLGITLSEFEYNNKTPYQYLEELKQHPSLKPLIKDAEVKEYSAHLIPEGGFKAIPQLVHNGLMIVGDAAMLVNNIHWEGSNLAMISGKLAAETAVKAVKNNDYSRNSLSDYEKQIKQSFIYKDMASYRNVLNSIENNNKIFLGFYPKKINEFMNMFTSVDSIPKKQKYRRFISNTLKQRSAFKIMSDGIKIAKLAGEAIL